MVALQIQPDNNARLAQIKDELKGHFLAVGKLLCEVDDKKLYRLDKQPSLTKWVKETLGYSPGWASQHMTAYRQNTEIIDAGSLPLKNLSAARQLNSVICDKTNIDAIAVAILASRIANDAGRDSITVDDINAAYQINLDSYPQPVRDVCERFGVTNPDKVKILTNWFFEGKGRDDSKWESLIHSGKLILSHPDKDDDILNIASCTAAEMSAYALKWQAYVRRIADDANPNRQLYEGVIADIIEKLKQYAQCRARVTVIIETP